MVREGREALAVTSCHGVDTFDSDRRAPLRSFPPIPAPPLRSFVQGYFLFYFTSK